jgi:5-carboxyvanillate decarboxylase
MSQIIDWHTHWLSPRALAFLESRQQAPRVVRNERGELGFQANSTSLRQLLPVGPSFFDGPTRIAHIDEAGIARQVISWPTTLGVDPALDAAEGRALFAAYNDDLAALIRQYPQRLSALAALSTADIAWSAQELERAHRELGFIGAVLPAGAFLNRVGAEALAPIFAVAQRHRSHIYLHTGLAHPSIPGQWSHPPAADAATARWLLESTSQFAGAWITLGLTDFLDAYPDVSVQLAMLGGVLPFLASTLDSRVQRQGLPSVLPGLRRVYIDSGILGTDPQALALAISTLGSERILFGSDYPLVSSTEVLTRMIASGLPKAEIDTVLHNGHDILRRFQ